LTGYWLIFARRNRVSLPYRFSHRQPGHLLPRCLFSQEANSQPHISKDATENPMARTAAYSRSRMDENELHGHLSEKLFRAIGNYFANLSSSVGSISEEIYSRQAVYFSYTWLAPQGSLIAPTSKVGGTLALIPLKLLANSDSRTWALPGSYF